MQNMNPDSNIYINIKCRNILYVLDQVPGDIMCSRYCTIVVWADMGRDPRDWGSN